MIAMAHALADAGKDFELHYCGRSRAASAFIDELNASPFSDRVHLHFDDEAAAQKLDLARALVPAQAAVEGMTASAVQPAAPQAATAPPGKQPEVAVTAGAAAATAAGAVAPALAAIQPLAQAVAALEARAIREALAATGGNKQAAARLLGIARATLYERLSAIPDSTA